VSSHAAWLTLKLAHSLYQRGPVELSDAELAHVNRAVRQQQAIESRLLATPEAAALTISPQQIEQTLATLRGRYPNHDEFNAEIAALGMDESAFSAQIARDLCVEQVIELQSARLPPISREDCEIYYHLHPERFLQPERRRARHILITLNDGYGENRREVVVTRLNQLRQQLLERPSAFAGLAMRHSECPTALQGGDLGRVVAGQLYPELDRFLFRYPRGSLSTILTSPVGLHLLRCEGVEAAGAVPFAEVAPRIHEYLTTRQQQRYLRRWLSNLAV
jgi:peptidyl-prolyl cis-trans isomerase C